MTMTTRNLYRMAVTLVCQVTNDCDYADDLIQAGVLAGWKFVCRNPTAPIPLVSTVIKRGMIAQKRTDRTDHSRLVHYTPPVSLDALQECGYDPISSADDFGAITDRVVLHQVVDALPEAHRLLLRTMITHDCTPNAASYLLRWDRRTTAKIAANALVRCRAMVAA